MRENIFITHGVIFSQPVLLALIKKGMPREAAYQLIQTKAMDCWNQKKDFKTELLNDPEITTRLNRTEIDNCFQFDQVLSNVDFIFRRMGLINS
jgi:adenylosuccinate lyase